MASAESSPLDAGFAEARRHEQWEQGNFDGLFGQFDKNTSRVLRDTLTDLRNYLLEHCSNDATKARELLTEHELRPGYRNVTPVPDDIALVLRLLNGYRSLLQCTVSDYEKLMYGERDRRHLAGARKKRLEFINEWIDAQLKRTPDVKSPELYAAAPTDIRDFVGPRRFAARVTARRKMAR